MIVSDDFIWLHFPKCAGTRIESIFRKYYSNDKRIHQDPVGLGVDPTIAWHDSIRKRMKKDAGFSVAGRMIICSFRRLPSWLISRYNFEVQRSPQLNHDPCSLFEGRFLEQNGKIQHADAMIDRYLTELIEEGQMIKYLRVEYIREDFLSIFGQFVDISIIPEEEFSFRENRSGNHIDSEILKRLYSEVDTIYANCPKWKAIEEVAYP